MGKWIFKEAIHESLRATSATIYYPPKAVKELNIKKPQRIMGLRPPCSKEKKPKVKGKR